MYRVKRKDIIFLFIFIYTVFALNWYTRAYHDNDFIRENYFSIPISGFFITYVFNGFRICYEKVVNGRYYIELTLFLVIGLIQIYFFYP